jgi:molybdopterin synthase catalytic subunit
VVFLGTVRDHSQGRSVTGIEYTAYERLAEARLGAIVADLERQHAGLRVAIVHRLGHLTVGEISIAIVTAAAHREGAYEANRAALERVKREVPIWKDERYDDGTRAWREVEPLGGT